MAFDVGTAIGYLDLDTSGFNKGFKSAAQDLKTFATTAKGMEGKTAALGAAFTSVGRSMTKGVTLPLVGLGTAAMAVGNKFESAMSRVQGISGATGEELKKLSDQALDLGAKTSFSATEAAMGMENLASAGFNTNEIMAAMPGLLDLAASSGASVADASEIAASAIRGFGLEASDAGHVADVFAEAAARTNAQTEDMGMAMKYIAPVARAMGMSLEETAAAIGIMSDAGIKGSQAGTSLRGALTRLAKPTKQMTEVMDTLGLSFYDIQGNMLPLNGIISQLETSMSGLTQQQRNQALVTLFGQESLSGMLALMGRGSEELNALTESFEQVDGAAGEMADTMLNNTSGAIEEMMGSLETLAIKIQQILAPAVTSAAKWLTELFNKFSSLSTETQTTIVKIAGFAAALGPGMLLLGKLFTAVSKVAGAFKVLKGGFVAVKAALAASSAPILGVIAAIVAAVVALKLTWDNNFGGIQEKTAALGESLHNTFQSILGLLSSFVGFFKGLWESNWLGCQDSFRLFWTGVETAFSSLLDAILSVFKVFESVFAGDWKGAWEAVKDVFGNLLNGLLALLVGCLEAIISRLISIGSALFSAAKTAFGKIKEGFLEVWEKIKSWFGSAVDTLVETVTGIGSSLYDAGVSAIESLWNGFKSVWDTVKGWVSEAASWIVDTLSVNVTPTVNPPAKGGSGGSYASGLDYVPRDMTVKVHEGESIRTKQQTKEDTSREHSGDTYVFYGTEPLNEDTITRRVEQVKRDLAEGF